MNFYWAIISPLALGIALFLSVILTRDKKRIGMQFLGLISLFNIYSVINLINIFRRDFNGDISIFPLFNYLAYLTIINAFFLSFSLLVLKKLDRFKENKITQKIDTFFFKINDNIFLNERGRDKLISIIIIFCLLYIVGSINLYIHEFGHGMAFILLGAYYRVIGININLQGWAAGSGFLFDDYYFIKYSIVYLSGLILEVIFAFSLLIIIFKKKEISNFMWLLSIVISMLFLNRVALYFTFPQLFNIPSDVSGLVFFGFNPWVLFLIFLPFLIFTLAFTFRLMSRFYKSNLKRDKRFLKIYFLGLSIYIVVLVVLFIVDQYITPLVTLLFY